MKVKFKHGIVFIPDMPLKTVNNIIRLDLNAAPCICNFLYDGSAVSVWLEKSTNLQWKTNNKSNILFIEFYNGRLIPISVETDGNSKFYSGSVLPKVASNGSTFYNIQQNKLYLMQNNRWVEKSVIRIAKVTGNNIIIEQIGSQLGGFYEVDSGQVLYGPDGNLIPSYDNSYDTNKKYSISPNNFFVTTNSDNLISVMPLSRPLQDYTPICLDSGGYTISTLEKYCNGITVAKNSTHVLICHAGSISDVHIPLNSGLVFNDGKGKISNISNEQYYEQIGSYNQITKILTVDIRPREKRL